MEDKLLVGNEVLPPLKAIVLDPPLFMLGHCHLLLELLKHHI